MFWSIFDSCAFELFNVFENPAKPGIYRNACSGTQWRYIIKHLLHVQAGGRFMFVWGAWRLFESAEIRRNLPSSAEIRPIPPKSAEIRVNPPKSNQTRPNPSKSVEISRNLRKSAEILRNPGGIPFESAEIRRNPFEFFFAKNRSA